MVSGAADVLRVSAPALPAPGSGLDLHRLAWRLLCGFVFAIPFSIFLGQLLLSLATAAAIADGWKNGWPELRTPLDVPIACFLAAALLAALVGLNPPASLWGLRTYLQLVIVYLVYAYAQTPERGITLVRWFLVASALTGAYRLLGVISETFPRLFLGQMTQSGQLLFALSLAVPVLLRGVFPAPWLRPALVIYLLAIVVNLKRGVWLGSLASSMTIGWLASRRVMLAAILLIFVTVSVASPVRARIANSTRDFFLPGNRYDIWLAAIDVVKRFPMGVGRKNGAILRDYANIPQSHKHAHNTLLQITLESGYLGLVMFVWWMCRFGLIAWRTYARIPSADALSRALAMAVFASFVGFHVAGLVEYNFGDSEVLEIFFVVMGLGLALDRRNRRGE